MILKFKFSVIFAITFFNIINAQIPNNSLFIIIDENSKSIKTDENKTKVKYTIWNENQNWYSYLDHYATSGSRLNNLKYILPKEIVNDFTERGNVITSYEFETMLSPLNIENASDLLRLRYPRYYYEYVENNTYKKILRYGIFLIFKSDLNNNFIKCFETNIVFDRIEQH